MKRTQPLLTKEHINKIFNANKSVLSKNGSIEKAIKDIDSLDFPNRKTPGWEKTNLQNILRHKYSKPDTVSTQEDYIRQFTFYGIDADILVFTNGMFDEKLSVIKSAEALYIGSIQKAFKSMPKVLWRYFDNTQDDSPNIFNAVNRAYAEDGFLVYIPDDAKTERPIHIMHFIDGDTAKPMVQSRNLIVAGKNTNVDILTSYHSVLSDFSLTNVLSEIIIEEEAQVSFNIFQGEGYDAAHINKTLVKQEKSSRFKSNTATMCGTVVKNEIQVDFTDELCDAQINGFYLPARRQVTDNTILINHNKANCTSSQFYRGIIEDHGNAVFTGKIYVAKDAQHTDSAQSNKNILMSADAKAYSRPQLEIYADDVACAHGSTVGQIEQNALFYLQTRGISKRTARTLLLYAFIGEALDKIEIQAYKEYVSYLLNKRLRGEDMKSLCQVKICPGC